MQGLPKGYTPRDVKGRLDERWLAAGGTAAGDAYTLAEFDKMFRDAGFGKTEAKSLAPAPSTLLLTRM